MSLKPGPTLFPISFPASEHLHMLVLPPRITILSLFFVWIILSLVISWLFQLPLHSRQK